MLENPAWEQAEAEARRAIADNAEWEEAMWTQNEWATRIDQAKAAALAEENQAWENAEWSAKIDIAKLETSPQEVQEYFQELMAALPKAEMRLKDAEAQAQRMGIDTETLIKRRSGREREESLHRVCFRAHRSEPAAGRIDRRKTFHRDPRAYAEMQHASALRAMTITEFKKIKNTPPWRSIFVTTYLFFVISSFNFLMNCAVVIFFSVCEPRVRTVSDFNDFSFSPTTSIYGVFMEMARRML